jgi:hypothetical protein
MTNPVNFRLTSKFRTGFDNLSVPVDAVMRIEKKTCNDRLSVLYFYGLNEKNSSQVIRTWFYQSASDLEKDLMLIQKKFPDLDVH